MPTYKVSDVTIDPVTDGSSADDTPQPDDDANPINATDELRRIVGLMDFPTFKVKVTEHLDAGGSITAKTKSDLLKKLESDVEGVALQGPIPAGEDDQLKTLITNFNTKGGGRSRRRRIRRRRRSSHKKAGKRRRTGRSRRRRRRRRTARH